MERYAYLYIDPITNVPFYVGKGSRDRATSHMSPTAKTSIEVAKKIKVLKDLGLKPIISKVKTSTNETAFAIERFLIALFGKQVDKTGSLLNISDGGNGSYNFTRTKEVHLKISNSLKKYYQTHTHFQTPEAIEKIRIAKKLRPTGTGKWMNNGLVQIKVKLEDVDSKLSNGWSYGTLKKHITEEYRAKLSAASYKQWERQKEHN